MGQTASSQYSSGTGISWTIMPAILAAIPAAVAAAGKAVASVGVAATWTVADYSVIRAIQKGDEPTQQISHSFCRLLRKPSLNRY